MRRSRNWKDNTRNRKAYGKRNTWKYDTPFMLLDEVLFGRGDEG